MDKYGHYMDSDCRKALSIDIKIVELNDKNVHCVSYLLFVFSIIFTLPVDMRT